MNAIRSGAIQRMLVSNIRWKDLLDVRRGLLDRGETLKHHFQTDAVASFWLNQSRDDRKSKTRPRNKHQIIRQIRVDDRSETYMSAGKYEPRGERDVIRFRNSTEDKRAFRRMLTSADLYTKLVRVISLCFAKKDSFQNMGFCRLKCQLKRKKIDTACF